MRTKTSDDEKLLEHMLLVLVGRWGYDKVERSLVKIARSIAPSEEFESRLFRKIHQDRGVDERIYKNYNRKLSALDLVERTNTPEKKKSLLLDLARQYERKDFLPRMGDVKYFLEMQGHDAGNIKQRPEAFRKVLSAIHDMPEEYLEKLVKSSRYSGPAQLGPLSDAIKSARGNIKTDKNTPGHSRIGEDKSEVNLDDYSKNNKTT